MLYRLILLCCLSPVALAADLDLGVIGSPDDPSSRLVVTDSVIVGRGAQCDYIDDARLQTIGALIADVSSGKKIKPLKVTVETFLDLDVDLIKSLDRNIAVLQRNCKLVPIVDGRALGRLHVNFYELFPVIEEAIKKKNVDKLKFIKKNMRVNPLSGDEMLPLVTLLEYDKKQLKLIKKTLHVKPKFINGQGYPRLYMIAFYHKLGGRIRDRSDKIYYHERLRNMNYKKACFFTASSDSSPINRGHAKAVMALFNRMGLKIERVGKDIPRVKQIKGIAE